MKNELEQLMKLAGSPEFGKKLDELHKKYGEDPVAKREIAKFIRQGIADAGKRIALLEKEVNKLHK